MEAIQLLDNDDLQRTKIPRGQQKLILASITKILKSRERAEESAHAQLANGVSTDVTNKECPTAARVTRSAHANSHSQSDPTGNRKEMTHDGGAPETTNSVDAFTILLNSLQAGQSVAKNNIALNSLASPVSGPGPVNNVLLTNSSASNTSQSWQDPQIFLESAASGKSAPTHYDITEFVANSVEEEVLVGANGTQQVVVKTGPRRPKLEIVTLAQWFVANLAILYRLVEESKLHAGNILDYLSYTTKVCQLVQRYTLVSVLLYDREYRQLQARHGFRWGTNVPHFHTIHLQPRVVRQLHPDPVRVNKGNQKSSTPVSSMTLDGKVICKLYNSKSGVSLQRMQVCSSVLTAWLPPISLFN